MTKVKMVLDVGCYPKSEWSVDRMDGGEERVMAGLYDGLGYIHISTIYWHLNSKWAVVYLPCCFDVNNISHLISTCSSHMVLFVSYSSDSLLKEPSSSYQSISNNSFSYQDFAWLMKFWLFQHTWPKKYSLWSEKISKCSVTFAKLALSIRNNRLGNTDDGYPNIRLALCFVPGSFEILQSHWCCTYLGKWRAFHHIPDLCTWKYFVVLGGKFLATGYTDSDLLLKPWYSCEKSCGAAGQRLSPGCWRWRGGPWW